MEYRNLTTELIAFAADNWPVLAAFAVSQSEDVDGPGFAYFKGDLDLPDPVLDVVVRPETGTAPVLRFDDGPLWIDVSYDGGDLPPESIAAAAVAPSSGEVVVVWEFEPGAVVWAAVHRPTPPVDEAVTLAHALWAASKN